MKTKVLFGFWILFFGIVSFLQADITTGLTAQWTFAEGSGFSVNDQSGNGHNGSFPSYATDPRWITGASTGALSFNGSGLVVGASQIKNFITTTDGTISIWFNASSGNRGDCTNGQVSALVTDGIDNGAGYVWMGYDGHNVCAGGSSYPAGGNQSISAPTPQGQWTHAVWVHHSISPTDGTLTLYVNGSSAGSVTLGDIGSLYYTLVVGESYEGGQFFNGSVAGLRTYNRALSAADVLEIYNAEKSVMTNVASPVYLSSPVDGAIYPAGQSLPLSATLGAPANQLDFYDGARKLTTLTSAPYIYTFNNPTSTLHKLTTVATDSHGFRTVSNGVLVNVGVPQNLSNGLVGYWNFDDSTGTVATDVSGNLNDGTLANGAIWVPGVSGSALLMESNQSGVTMPFKAINLFSYSFYIFPFNSGVYGQNFLYQSAGGEGGDNPCYAIGYTTDGTLSFNSAEFGPTALTTVLPKGKWSHVVAVNDPNVGDPNYGAALYVDGVPVETSATPLSCGQAPGNLLQIGRQPSAIQRDFRGGIDDLRIYNRVLSRTEVAQLYNSLPQNLNPNPPIIISHTSTEIIPYANPGIGALSVVTGGPAACSYSTVENKSFDQMTSTMGTTDNYNFISTVPLQSGLNNFYVRCKDDGNGLSNQNDFIIPIFMHKNCTNDSDTNLFVSTDGTTTNCGSLSDPWTLAYAASGAEGKVKPGDIVWLRAGTYTGPVNISVSGSAGSPVTFRNYNRERAIYDGQGGGEVFNYSGSYLQMWGLEFLDSKRGTVVTKPYSTFGGGDDATDKFINIISHDNGIGTGGAAEAYGNILYNNGRNNNLEHGIYWHNNYYKVNGFIKNIKDNIIFNAGNYGIHIYGTGNAVDDLQGFLFDGNTLINNAFLDGGGTPIDHTTIEHTFTYTSPGLYWTNSSSLALGYSGSMPNDNVVVANNYFTTLGPPLIIQKPFSAITVKNNTFVSVQSAPIAVNAYYGPPGAFPSVSLPVSCSNPYDFDSNSYYSSPGNSTVYYKDLGYSVPLISTGVPAAKTWQGDTGFDLHSTAKTDTPPDQVFIRPNQYEPGRAQIIIYNWSQADTVNVDVSDILESGHHYELHSAQDYFGDTTTGVTLNGPLAIPMKTLLNGQPDPHTVAAQLNNDNSIPGVTAFPQFGAFDLIDTTVSPQAPARTYFSIIQFGTGKGMVVASRSAINCGPNCQEYNSDPAFPVTLTATPASGSVFAGWSGGGCSGTGTCTNPTHDVTASFNNVGGLSLITQPTDQTVASPGTATFAVVANGTSTITYQWQKSTDQGLSWLTLCGAAGTSYTTPPTVAADSGSQFRCVVTNNAGDVTSGVATLTVNPSPFAKDPEGFLNFKNVANLSKAEIFGITLLLKQAHHVDLRAYTRTGEEVEKIYEGDLKVGSQVLTWDARNSQGSTVASGVYLLVLKMDGIKQTRKVVVIK